MPYADAEAKRAYQRKYTGRDDVKARRRETFREWAEKNREKRLANEARRRLEKRAMVLVATVRTRARKRGLDFDLDQHIAEIQRRIDLGVCEVTGQPFDLSPGRSFNSPSIDRIYCSKGYTHENTRIVLNLVNAALGDWGEETLRKVMSEWLSK